LAWSHLSQNKNLQPVSRDQITREVRLIPLWQQISERQAFIESPFIFCCFQPKKRMSSHETT
jgi:hypothetical protein